MLISASFVYVRKTPSLADIKKIKHYTFESEVMMGDLNINTNVEEHKTLMDTLCSCGKSRFLNEVTTNQLNQLGHILIEEKYQEQFCNIIKNFLSDHKTITIRISYIGNKFSKEFEGLINFDEEHHLKQKKQQIPKNQKESPEISKDS